MNAHWAILRVVYLALLTMCIAGCQKQAGEAPSPQIMPTQEEAAMEWSLTSPALSNNARIPPKYTADGADVSPPLSWTTPPEGTVELALICNDPDAPVGDWIHWVLYGLSPDQEALSEGIPASGMLADLGGAKQGRNDFGRIGYGGPAPPRGADHHYHFRLYALDAPMNLPPGATAAELKSAMQGCILAEAEIVGLYSR